MYLKNKTSKFNALTISCFILLFSVCFNVSGRDKPPKKDFAYDLAIAQIEARSSDADFSRLRSLFSQSSHYAKARALSHERLWKALEDKRFKQCIKYADKLLKKNFTSMAAHFGASVCHGELAESLEKESSQDKASPQKSIKSHRQKSDYHQYVFGGLVDSIKNSGDGGSLNTAFKTVSDQEVYDFVDILGYKLASETLLRVGSRRVKQLSLVHPEQEAFLELYFDVSVQSGSE